MRKVLIVLALFVFILTGTSLAAPISLTNVLTFNSEGALDSGDGRGELTDHGWGSVNLLNGAGDYVKWTQAFTFSPTPESGSVTGKLSIKLRDDSNRWLDGPEFAIGWTNTGSWAIGEVDTGTYNYNVSLNNGSLTVTLASLGGDFFIDSSTLTVNYSSAAAPVPEPASMLLVGLGMISVGFFARRRNKLPK
jgi:hypothetical protein